MLEFARSSDGVVDRRRAPLTQMLNGALKFLPTHGEARFALAQSSRELALDTADRDIKIRASVTGVHVFAGQRQPHACGETPRSIHSHVVGENDVGRLHVARDLFQRGEFFGGEIFDSIGELELAWDEMNFHASAP